MRQIALISLCVAVLVGMLAHSRGSSGDPPPATQPGLIVHGSVHLIRLPELETELPKGIGADTTKLYCATCHTTRYILIQPPLSRETWLTEVTKMKKVFSAPIPDEKVPEIVEYLMSVNGAASAPAPASTPAK